MRTSLSLALAPALLGFAVMTVAAAPAWSQAADYGVSDQRMQTERQYNESLRKGGAIESPAVIQQQSQIVTPRTLALEDQFPMQGTDNPSGLLGQDDFNDEGRGVEWYIQPGIPVSGSNQVGELDPQEAPPGYRRGGGG